MNRLLCGIFTLASIVATMTTATHITMEDESRFHEDNPQFAERRSHHAYRGKKASSKKGAKQRFPSATRKHPPGSTNCRRTPSPSREKLQVVTRRPTPYPTPSPSREKLQVVTRRPTPYPTYSPVTLNDPYCLDVDKEVYDCGEPITVFFDVSGRENPEPARIRDFIGIFPHYVSSYDVPEVWQWTCGPPPFVPNTCSNGPQYSRSVVFNGLPKYNLEPSDWPVTANYDPFELEVNRFFKVVLLRGDGTTYCVSRRFKILENGLPGCSIRLSSPSG